ncbi:hypothetical protein [Streptomyces flavidovirens]|uniref:Uncharacterized protein n=1 Tax=Streptomyces flavidovirens TaxID=67298 RepID=A0ABW6RF04_9ACTN
MLFGPWEVRVHRLEAPEGAGVREGGHAVAATERPRAETGPRVGSGPYGGRPHQSVVALHGWDAEEAAGVSRDVQANAYGPHSATPYLRLGAHPGGHSVHVSLIALSRDTVHPRALRDSVIVEVLDGPVSG